MALKVLTDINILIDFFDNQRAHHTSAIELFKEAENGSVRIFVTESILNTTSYLIRKYYTASKIKNIFQELLTFTQIIPINNVVYSAGLHLAVNDLEDAILYAAALSAKLDYFVTNNVKDYRRIEIPSLPVVQANDILELL